MLILGLTGGIATGKSTVSSLLASPPYSFPIIDADTLAREVVLPGTSAYTAIVSHFSRFIPDLVLDSGALNRPALGRHIFSNSSERTVLNSITHPAIRRAMLKRVLYLWITGAPVVVLDVPLLFESKLHKFCGLTLVIACSPSTQRQRLLARDGAILSESDADQRISSQMSIESKAALADIVISNESSKQELESALARAVASFAPSRLRTLLERFPPFGALVALFVFLSRSFSRP
ncbi:dephospho-CoA kinase [Lipomyces arxii]|uniref:dephospho-CoA kinase n=1 Tax=Lipomyces arxii TaxID=56418 RepID=UPI0034CD1CFE